MLEEEGARAAYLLELDAHLLVVDLEDTHERVDNVRLASVVCTLLLKHQLVLGAVRPVLYLLGLEVIAEAAFDQIGRIHREEQSLLTLDRNVVVEPLGHLGGVEQDLLVLDGLLKVKVPVDAVTVVQLARFLTLAALGSLSINLLVDNLHALEDECTDFVPGRHGSLHPRMCFDLLDRRPVGRRLLQHGSQQALDLLRVCAFRFLTRVDLPEAAGVVFSDGLIVSIFPRSLVKRQVAEDHLEKHDAGGEEVRRSGIVRLVVEDLRSHVVSSSQVCGVVAEAGGALDEC